MCILAAILAIIIITIIIIIVTKHRTLACTIIRLMLSIVITQMIAITIMIRGVVKASRIFRLIGNMIIVWQIGASAPRVWCLRRPVLFGYRHREYEI